MTKAELVDQVVKASKAMNISKKAASELIDCVFDEVGKAINPIGVAGQIEGGIQQGIGNSLTEDYVVDPKTGRSLNANFVDYKMPLSMDMPPVKTIILEEYPDPTAPFGAKGVGEDPIIAIGPAIANAVFDAIGVRIRELPITPEKVLKALREKEKV